MKPEGGGDRIASKLERQIVANLGSGATPILGCDVWTTPTTSTTVTGAPIVSRRSSITGDWEYVAEMFAAAAK